MYLDEVLPKVVAGTWTKTDVENVAKVEEEVSAVFEALGGSDADKGLKSLQAFQKRHPLLAGIPYFVGPQIKLLLLSKKVDEARQATEEAIAKAIEACDPPMLSRLSSILRSPDVNNDKALLNLSLKAAEAWLKLAGDKDMLALWNLAESHYALGDKEKAKEYGAKSLAVSASESDEVVKFIRRQIKKYDEDKKDK